MKTPMFILLFTLSLLITGCKSCSTGSSFSCPQIKELYDNPDDFQGKEACVEGIVKEGTNLYLLKYYTLQDETGAIIIVTNGAVPNEGKKKKVYGKVNQYFKMPGQGSVMVIEEI